MSHDLYRPTLILRCFLAAALLAVCSDRSSQAQEHPTPAPPEVASAATAAAAQGPTTPCPSPPPCTGTTGKCANYPYAPTVCWTTPYGPPRADVVSSLNNMLLCNSGGAYALCFFSGPPDPTGQNPANKRLPCTLEQGNVAICTCQVYTSGPYFVDINGILNRGVYYQTVNACGPDGSGCANLENCGPKGDLPGCSARKQAPVCGYVKNQTPSNSSISLIPRADLISTFSFAMNNDYPQGGTPCTTTPGLYAGCMTAPCYYPPKHNAPPVDGERIRCECPVYDGKFQIGQKGQACTIPSNGKETFVWSASYNPNTKSSQ